MTEDEKPRAMWSASRGPWRTRRKQRVAARPRAAGDPMICCRLIQPSGASTVNLVARNRDCEQEAVILNRVRFVPKDAEGRMGMELTPGQGRVEVLAELGTGDKTKGAAPPRVQPRTNRGSGVAVAEPGRREDVCVGRTLVKTARTSRCLKDPSEDDMEELRRVARYLKEAQSKGPVGLSFGRE